MEKKSLTRQGREATNMHAKMAWGEGEQIHIGTKTP